MGRNVLPHSQMLISWAIPVAVSMNHWHCFYMDESDLIPIETFATAAQELPLEHQAGCLMTVLESVIHLSEDLPPDPISAELTGSDARQIFRRYSESLCRPLSKDQTRVLYEQTLFQFCEELTRARSTSIEP